MQKELMILDGRELRENHFVDVNEMATQINIGEVVIFYPLGWPINYQIESVIIALSKDYKGRDTCQVSAKPGKWFNVEHHIAPSRKKILGLCEK